MKQIALILCMALCIGGLQAQTTRRYYNSKPAGSTPGQKTSESQTTIKVTTKSGSATAAAPRSAQDNPKPAKEDNKNTVDFLVIDKTTNDEMLEKLTNVLASPDAYIKYFVNRQMKLWQQKNEYEDLNMYKIRTQPSVRKAKQEEFFNNAMSAYGEFAYLSFGMLTPTLGEYDEKNSTFLVSFPAYGQIALKVLSEEARDLRINWNRAEFKAIKFAPIKDLSTGKAQIALSHISVFNPINFKTYEWSITDNTPHQRIPMRSVAITNLESVLGEKSIIDTSGFSDVDKGIVKTRNIMPYTYALIIGNEYYKNLMVPSGYKMDASYAINDAVMFREYCINTLGVPLAQTNLLVNVDNDQMRAGIEWLIDKIRMEEGKANIIVYFAGLVLPDERTEEPYLLPADYDNSTLMRAVGLNNLYRRLSDYPAARTTLFLDVRHMTENVSNITKFFEVEYDSARYANALRTIKDPKEISVLPYGNAVVFTSKAFGDNSGSNKERKHGFFSYFLLKAIQQTKGNITYRVLQDAIYNNLYNVEAGAAKRVFPVCISEDIPESDWEDWQLNRP
jgi:hypothetical protein